MGGFDLGDGSWGEGIKVWGLGMRVEGCFMVNGKRLGD